MESSHFIFLCLLTALALYLVSQDASSSSTAHFPGRRFMVEFKTSTPKYEYYRVQNVDEGMTRSTIKESSMMLTYSSSGESSDELVYHIDYHGVTTHPTPKHPKP